MNDWFNDYFKSSRKNDNEDLWNEFKQEVNKLEKNKKTLTSKFRSPFKTFPDFEQVIFSSLPERELQPFDYNIKRRITREKIEIEATLDLHGLTILEAEKKVIDFILHCYTTTKSYVLIITGKGSYNHGRQTLRSELPIMLADIRIASIIISFTHAGKKHGDKGAYYVLLRKKKAVDNLL